MCLHSNSIVPQQSYNSMLEKAPVSIYYSRTSEIIKTQNTGGFVISIF